MTAAEELARWVKENAGQQMADQERVTDAFRLANKVLDEERERGQGKSLTDRAFDMWMVMASSGEYRVGPSGRDIVRTARAMMEEVATPTPWPERKTPQADGLTAAGWNPPPEDELARY